MFQRYQRSEQALMLAMIEMVINGVSTRKIENITEELCGQSFSKSTVSKLCENLDPIVEEFRQRPLEKHYPFVIVDAMYIKVREDNRVRSKGLLIATAVNENGNREVIGFQISDTESETSWGDFFNELKQRGLSDVDLIVSDNHKGLVNAIKKHFQGSSWQRCQTHFSRNILDKAPKNQQPELKRHLNRLYNTGTIEEARCLLKETLANIESKAPKAMALLEEGFDDVMSVMSLPEKYRKRLRTTNSIERLNEEIRRRDRVIRIYPNEQSVIRLLGALLIEQDEKWSSGRKYFDMEEYYEFINSRPSDHPFAAA
jgi:transposase-like protein